MKLKSLFRTPTQGDLAQREIDAVVSGAQRLLDLADHHQRLADLYLKGALRLNEVTQPDFENDGALEVGPASPAGQTPKDVFDSIPRERRPGGALSPT